MSPYCKQIQSTLTVLLFLKSKTQRILSEIMKLLAFGLVLLSFLQSFATSDYQVAALYEMRMQLSDDGGVLKDWKDNQMTPCNWTNIDCQDNKVIAITLSSSSLVGILSPSIAKITTLQQWPKTKSNVWILVVVSSLLGVALCIIFCFGPIVFRSLSKGQIRNFVLLSKQRVRDRSNVIVHRDVELVWETEGNNPDFTFFNYSQVLDATNDFSVENKLGQGGFGLVYKGRLPDGLEIAVKRLASHSMQGFREFRNEVQLIAKLQHRNLVRLLGYCSHGEEKMLVYEYMKNKSLDFFIFDEKRRTLLNLDKRLVIIEGIAQGLLYLHKHSRLRVIHRDVKASNILLDHEMNPKISDFGMAKMFSSNDNEGNTERVVGTYGYMAPEYASEGLFSTKSDVFSFGVLILEIITGERNSGFYYHGNFLNLLGYAWKLWKEQRWPELVDISLATNGCTLEMMRCINIALLCVQENVIDRPTTSDVVAMLGSEDMALPKPKHL
ncbi:unnamed protein product [Miscanthus lutarioriparius]|uniref:non-specific serine/threonine protein kinase n=1 Tax=Miscanthus lutarioriparius TaxID=422564 RepID=A0A811R5F8_9POAL|nr:unnamed protein product [Miscanthus lutarioriparius]